jgi:5-bromo-4-chloroindolyl phosphate hydrolysis protein
METKAKIVAQFFAVIALVIVLLLLALADTATAEQEVIPRETKVKTEQVYLPLQEEEISYDLVDSHAKYVKTKLAEYQQRMKELAEAKSKQVGITDAAKESDKYSLSDKVVEQLRQIEADIQDAEDIDQVNDYVEKFNDILEENPYVEPKKTYNVSSNSSGAYSVSGFKSKGVINWNGWRWTWYSQNELAGGGLSIPGRHVADDQTIRDGDGYIVLASSVLSKGTVIDTPFGTPGKVYDSGCAANTIDVYTNF